MIVFITVLDDGVFLYSFYPNHSASEAGFTNPRYGPRSFGHGVFRPLQGSYQHPTKTVQCNLPLHKSLLHHRRHITDNPVPTALNDPIGLLLLPFAQQTHFHINMASVDLEAVRDVLVSVAYEAGKMMLAANPAELDKDTKLNCTLFLSSLPTPR